MTRQELLERADRLIAEGKLAPAEMRQIFEGKDLEAIAFALDDVFNRSAVEDDRP